MTNSSLDQGLLYSDLNHTNDGMPTQYVNLTKNSSIPDVSGGILWADEVNKVFWLYGGEYSTLAPASFQLWGYDTLLNQWNLSSTSAASSASSISRVSYGAGATIGGTGYYYGGYLNNMTNPRWNAPPLATSNLVVFDMDTNALTNSTGPDSIGRAEGVMVSIPASARGMLIYFGGVTFPYDNTTEAPMAMTNIMLYDIGDSKWYTQTATGNIPANRRKFCAGATWADDQSSYNIYLYGGFGFGENSTGFDDVYILSLPTFEWIKWYPEAPGASAPHGLLSCNVIDNAQMIVMGGNFTNSTACDAPTVGAQHNLNLGQQNILNDKWYQYLPNLTAYSVPSAISSVTGGSAGGGASNLSPNGGWSDAALSVYFGQKARFETRTPTRYIPSATQAPSSAGSKPNIGAIVGGAVGGMIVLIIIAVTIWWCLRKRKFREANRAHDQQPAQPRMSTVGELTGEPHYNSNQNKLAVVTATPGSPEYLGHQTHSPPPPFRSGNPMVYQHPIQDPQQHYQMQQQGYAYPQYPSATGSPPAVYSHQLHGSSPPSEMYPHHHSAGGSPPGTYPQQQYFPPPENIRTSPPIPHEMPTSKTPGVHHVYQPVPQRLTEMESISSRSQQEGSQKESYSYTHTVS